MTLASGETNNTIDAGLYQPAGDISITKTDGLVSVLPGQTIVYTIVASNNGPIDALNAVVQDTFPSQLTNVSWTSVASGGASGNDLSGTGNINDTVNLVAGSSITYTVTATVASGAALTTLADFGAGTNNTNLGQNITIGGVKADAFYLSGTNYLTTNTVLWERDVTDDHGIGVWSNGEPDPIVYAGDVNEISNQLNADLIRLTKPVGQAWSSLWVSSLDSGGSGSAETGTFYWSNSATPNLSTLTTKFTFQYGDFGANVEEGDVLSLGPTGFDASAQYVFFVAGPNAAGTNNDYLFWKATTAATTLTNTATVTPPNGFNDSNPGNNSSTDTDNIVRPASLGDYVWNDANSNGVQDAGELGISGATVKLLDSTGTTTLATATTDANGLYHFTGLTPGSYQVQFVTPSGYAFSTQDAGSNDALDSDANVSTGKSQVVTLASGQVNNTVDAGLHHTTGDLSITKTDGLTSVLPGQTIVYTIVASNSGPLDALNAVVQDTFPSQLTNVSWTSVASGSASGNDASGTGNINDTVNLVSGSSITYTVTATVASNAALTTLADFGAGTNNANLGQTITIGGVKADAFYTSGTNYLTTNTVLWERDLTNDHGIGVWSNGEPDPIANGGDVNEISNQLNADVIRLTKAAGQTWTSLWVSSLDSGGSGSAETGTLYWSNSATPNLSTLTTKFTFHYGDFGPNVEEGDVLSLGPTGFDASAQYVFFVAGPNAAGTNNDYLLWKATTGAATLTNTATVTAPSGFNDTNPGNNSASDTDNLAHPATGPATVGNYVWCDHNGNGIQDAGESAVAGITVKLLGAGADHVFGTGDDATLATTMTDANGLYSFTGLAAGSYQVQFVAPSGFSFSPQDAGANDAPDSDANTATGKSQVFTLAAGQTNNTIDAGLLPVHAVFDFSGSSASDGTDGNIRSFTQSGISVHVSAFSEDKGTGAWNAGYLGSYGGGLGVTDIIETGSNNTHTVDNTGGQDNYVLFEFNQNIVLDKAFLGYVVGDSDLQLWIGNFSNAYNSHLTLSDSVLSNMGFTQVDTTTLTTTRWSDLNPGSFVGNVIVIAADTTDTSPEDFFKILNLDVTSFACDVPSAHVCDKVWQDTNGNGSQDSGETGIAGCVVNLEDSSGKIVCSTTTDSNGSYNFDCTPGDYKVCIVTPSGYWVTGKNLGGNDSTDSDFNSNGETDLFTVAAGATSNLDAGLVTAYKTSASSYTLPGNWQALTYTGNGNFAGTGNGLNNVITGGNGNDTLDGLAGADTLVGGLGNDTYILDNAGDVVTENAGAGTDTVKTNLASDTLDANVENLIYTGAGTFAGTGNSLNNGITGGAGNDTLDGGAGNDTMTGGAGNDTYIVDNAGDVVTEAPARAPTRSRRAWRAETLDANVENLTYTGAGNFAGTGNSLANAITGGIGNDTLDGGTGADTMTGGAGNDTYIVDNAGDVVTEGRGGHRYRQDEPGCLYARRQSREPDLHRRQHLHGYGQHAGESDRGRRRQRHAHRRWWGRYPHRRLRRRSFRLQLG